MRLTSRIIPGILLAVMALAVIYTGYYAWTGHKAWAVMYDDSLGQSLGPAESDLVLVELMDYRCVHCRDLKPVLEQVQKAYPDLKIIIKHIPTSEAVATVEARIALAAAKIGKFEEVHNFLLEQEDAPSDAELAEILAANDIDPENFIELAKSEEVTEALVEVFPAVGRLGLTSTPAFIFRNKIYSRFSRVPTFEDFVLLLSQPVTQ